MESSVKNISRPVIDRLPVDVNQLDEFACRQLDKVCLHPHLCYIIHISHLQLEKYRRAPTLDDKMQVDGPVSQSSETGDLLSASLSATDEGNNSFYLASTLFDARSSGTLFRG